MPGGVGVLKNGMMRGKQVGTMYYLSSSMSSSGSPFCSEAALAIHAA